MSEVVFNRTILEKTIRILVLVSLISLALNIILVFGLLYSFKKAPLLVYSQEGELGVLRAKDLKRDEALLKDFMTMIAGQYLSFSYSSLPKQIENIKSYLDIKPTQVILESYKKNQAIIEKENISQQFTINSIVLTKTSNPFWVEIEGMRNIHAAGNDKSVAMTYVFEVKQVKSNESNPYGFLVTDVIEKDILNKGQAK